ncbi:MAG: DUF1598 domain-containing protein [Pirellulaceae bacterium]|nr:DUF1598 domain-containing protein [Pirellulaceae bacterium]
MRRHTKVLPRASLLLFMLAILSVIGQDAIGQDAVGRDAIGQTGAAQQSQTTTDGSADLQAHLDGGEFGLAAQLAKAFAGQAGADQAGAEQRDQIYSQVAAAQGSAGELAAAARTAANIQSPMYRSRAIEGARGGGSMADFGSLMQLIETTVEPDTWESLGGPSTMAPYPQGVYVDPDGTVKPCVTVPQSDALDDLKSVLRRDPEPGIANAADSWRQASKLRIVSLRRLRDVITQRQILGHPNTTSMINMAGLSRVQYIMIDGDDILLAGPVGGIEQIDGWFRDQKSGLNTLRSDFLFTTLASALDRQPFGCTIDPTPEGLQRAAAVAQGVQSNAIAVGKAADQMKTALGLQRVEVFGTAGDTPIGYVMVEADRHMKQLALGEQAMPEGVKNYLDIIDDTIAQGPPNQLLLRLWFTASPRSVRSDTDQSVFELGGLPIQLSGENQRALANGQRGQVTRDVRTEAFVDEFNRHWDGIRAKYPIYSALESIYRVASVSAVLDRYVDEAHRPLLRSLAVEATSSAWRMPTPRQVESIAKHHRVRHGRTIHHVVLASGGVSVDAGKTITGKLVSYPSLRSLKATTQDQPKLVQRWWWDAR